MKHILDNYAIVDDGIMQMDVRSPADVATLERWMRRLDDLVKGVGRPPFRVAPNATPYVVEGCVGKLNFSKFKILQHTVMRSAPATTSPPRESACPLS